LRTLHGIGAITPQLSGGIGISRRLFLARLVRAKFRVLMLSIDVTAMCVETEMVSGFQRAWSLFREPFSFVIILRHRRRLPMIRFAARKAALLIPPIRRLREQRDAALEEVNNLQRRLREQETVSPETGTSIQVDADAIVARSVEQALAAVRTEYTSLPRFAYHLPLDYEDQTLPPRFDPPVWVEGESLPLPPLAERHGHSASDAEYLDWGKYEKDIIVGYMRDALPSLDRLSVMDFGCSSGRILRHFYPETGTHGWKLTGVDVSARRIEWLRRNFPAEFTVYTGSVLPTLPFESNSFDVIYGMSVFTHIKFLWDFWLLELRRVLKPGGVLIQSIHTEYAWDFFVQHRHEPAMQDALGPMLFEHTTMPDDFVYYGNLDKNQVFWKKDVAIEFWSRYFRNVKVFPPPQRYSYQNWVVAIK
jgi:SAM-dependent methyltransferase